jgi:predicted DCC family thiol-disulfide oxidoreductase YuxK
MNANTHAVLFDGDCSFCQHSVRWLRRLDWRHVLTFVNLRDSGDPIVQAVPTIAERLREEMHVWPASRARLYHGFDALRWLSWRLPSLWLIAPFLSLPLVPSLGQRIYLWIARRRFELMPCRNGGCTIQKRRP